MLTRDEFQILFQLHKSGQVITQRKLASLVGLPLGKVNKLLKILSEKGFVENNNGCRITTFGLSSMEPYKVTNAIIMAAGMSTRFAPLSYEKPKALLKVKGEILIEREIRQLQEAGIRDITIVVGYMREKLYYLADKFNVKIVVNEDYYRYNNTSTLKLVMDQMDNTYICSSDNYFAINPFEDYVYRSYYAAVFSPGDTSEYCISFDKHERITSVSHGGSCSWYMMGHAYFSRDFSKKFIEILKQDYHIPIVRNQLWEDLYIRHIDEFEMYIRKYNFNDIKEFDSLDELRTFDENYLENTDSPIFRNICNVLHCKEKDIHDIKPLKIGLTNLSFIFECFGNRYVYRHPGAGTDKYIDRKSEESSMQVARELKLDNTFIYMDPVMGWKISRYISNARSMDYHNDEDVRRALSMIRCLHKSGKGTSYTFDIWNQIKIFEKRLKDCGRETFDGSEAISAMIAKLREKVDQDHIALCLNHCDCYAPNFLISQDGRINLIDWEYSGMADPAVDLGTFITCSDYNYEEAVKVIHIYFDGTVSDSELAHFIAYVSILSYYWFLWSLYQDSIGKPVGDLSYKWYQNTRIYGEKALQIYER